MMRPEVRRGYEKLYSNPTVKAITQVILQRKGMLRVCFVTYWEHTESHTIAATCLQRIDPENGFNIHATLIIQFAPTTNRVLENNTTIWSCSWLKNGDIAVGCIDGSTKILSRLFIILIRSSPSLETKFDMKSQHMGVVSVAASKMEDILATNTVDGYICLRNSLTGFYMQFG